VTSRSTRNNAIAVLCPVREPIRVLAACRTQQCVVSCDYCGNKVAVPSLAQHKAHVCLKRPVECPRR
jgi:hypothetical protein